MKNLALFALFCAVLALCPAVHAQSTAPTPSKELILPESGILDITMPKPENTDKSGLNFVETHPILRITPDKSELLKLDRDAVSVVVGNPAHLSVLLDTPKVLVLIPRAPGATHFSVLDRNGNPIMQRHVIVASPKQDYVRIRRSCLNAAEGSNCAATSVYFCPDMCHEVNVTQLEGQGGESSDAQEAPEETPLGPSDEGSAEPN